jgi:hypothetical protein
MPRQAAHDSHVFCAQEFSLVVKQHKHAVTTRVLFAITLDSVAAFQFAFKASTDRLMSEMAALGRAEMPTTRRHLSSPPSGAASGSPC